VEPRAPAGHPARLPGRRARLVTDRGRVDSRPVARERQPRDPLPHTLASDPPQILRAGTLIGLSRGCFPTCSDEARSTSAT
jgi:hypothetical protein